MKIKVKLELGLHTLSFFPAMKGVPLSVLLS